MTDCSKLQPGDRAMLVGTTGIQRRLYVRKVKVSKVYKNGQIVLVGVDQRYRPDGSPAGRREGYSTPAKLRAWDDAIWQKAQMQAAQSDMANSLFKLGKVFQKDSRDVEKASKIWESLPFEVRQMIEAEDET